MTVYISGPVTGMPDHNRTAFSVAAKKLVIAGHEPVNPINVGLRLRLKLKREPTWAEYMREDIKALMDCDGIYMLDGWELSRGSRIELCIAIELGIKRIEL